ncbi:hypothetical protein CEB94_33215 [Streptomyces hawaiiensis]|uniref:Uncharacterized protein n=1 Tax=Streptomyces hawaiiensis TaxID=67305 RepID=A0A6G5RNL4_9ACTN|nr:hypothetical protein CEB94_33215 [Streptomyces hawaiiensis]
MSIQDEAAAVRPLTLAWVSRHLEVGERIVRTEALHGGITAEMQRLTIGTRDGDIPITRTARVEGRCLKSQGVKPDAVVHLRPAAPSSRG